MNTIQVSQEHYDFARYVSPQRWASYREQIRVALGGKPKSVLYVGAGDNIVASVLGAAGCAVTRFDYDAALGVDVVGDVRKIDSLVEESSFDSVMCCQVLEHLPLNDFDATLAALCKVSRHRVIISLPYCHKHLGGMSIQVPKLPKLSIDVFVPKFWHSWKFDGEHYWEVGVRGIPVSRITNTISQHARIVEQFFVKGNHYHLFYVLEV